MRRATAPRWLAAAALVLGALAAFARDPFPASPAVTGRLQALDLASSLRGREPGLVVLDLRSSEAFDAGHVATARRFEPERSGRADLPAGATLVLYAETDLAADTAAATLLASGHPNVKVLEGGYASWVDGVLAPTLEPTLPEAERERIGELSRYFGGQPRSGHRLPTDTPRAARPRLQGRGC